MLMTLKEWRRIYRRSQEWVAEATGIPQTSISRYENGSRPEVPNARKIERVTDGAVTLDDWYPESGVKEDE